MHAGRADSTDMAQARRMVFGGRPPYDGALYATASFQSPPRGKLRAMLSSPARRRNRLIALAASAALGVMSCGAAAIAQVQSDTLPPVKGEAKADKKAAAAGGGAGIPSGSESARLRERVDQLEGQIVDMQVVIGTLESLARTGGGAAPAPVRSEASGGMAASDSARLDTLETQIRALTAQVEQLAAEMRNGNGPQRRSDAGAGYGESPQVDRFGSTTVTSDNADPSASFGAQPPQVRQPTPPVAPTPPAGPSTYGSESLPPPPGGGDQLAAVDPAASGNPKQLYETAYGYLLQQDYGNAQAGFREFLRAYPQDALAPNALYWLGESHYVQRNYADAAEAFDLVVQSYGASAKAPDAQLKRGMALAQLGKRQEACTVLRGVGSKFPAAPAHLKAKADGERQRIGCP